MLQGRTPLDTLLEYYRRSVDELSSDEAVHVKDVEKLIRTKMRLGMFCNYIVERVLLHILLCNYPPGLSQPSHPSVDGQNKHHTQGSDV